VRVDGATIAIMEALVAGGSASTGPRFIES
jgi:hypothetical protein